MKRTKMILTLAAMIGAMSLTGCSTKVTIGDGEETGTTSIQIETDATENTAAQTQKENTASKQEASENPEEFVMEPTTDWSTTLDADKEWHFALPAEEELAYSFNLKTDENTYQEYATIILRPAVECCRVLLIGPW